jgi:hypothetical protein
MAKAAIIEERTEQFIKSFNYLKDNGLINDNKEVAELFGYKSTSAISEILGRRTNIQPEMWEKFKKKYSIHSDVSESDFLKEEYRREKLARIEAEERERKGLEEDKAFFKELIRSSLAVILQKTEEMWARQKGTGDIVLHSLERLEGKKEGELIREADKKIFQIDKEAHTHGKSAVPGR